MKCGRLVRVLIAGCLGTLVSPVVALGWANESHDLAALIAYKNIPTTEPGGASSRPSTSVSATQLIVPTRPTTGPIGRRSQGTEHLIELTPGYLEGSKPVVLEQLEKAGVRLADVLNRVFP